MKMNKFLILNTKTHKKPQLTNKNPTNVNCINLKDNI